MSKYNSDIQTRSFEFALDILKFGKSLIDEEREYIISKQIMRSGTSVGANIREGKNAVSRKDFIHKLSISQKECDETIYWLELIRRLYDKKELETTKLINEASEILKILKTIIVRTKENMTRVK